MTLFAGARVQAAVAGHGCVLILLPLLTNEKCGPEAIGSTALLTTKRFCLKLDVLEKKILKDFH